MDQNPVAPFDMYADEVILWMERFKNSFSKNSTKMFAKVMSSMSGIGIVFIVLAFILKGENGLLNAAAFVGANTLIASVIIVGSMYLKEKREVKITYYITNYRLIELQEGKTRNIKFGYITNLKSVEIDNENKRPTFLEFKWDQNVDKEFLILGFYDTVHCRQMYDIIRNQQNEIEDVAVNYDFVTQ